MNLRGITTILDKTTPRAPQVECETCGEPTRGAKPHCTEHVYQNDYASEVLGMIAERGGAR